MRKLSMDQLRQKQMEILDYITAFCDANDICYILEGGTQLGAVRHKGYIPWDDDIDIGMLREDYDRFVALFPQKCDRSNYVLGSPELDKRWHIPFGKVMDMNTLFLQDGQDMGVNIDIFPYDDVPNDPKLTARMYKMRDRLKYISAAQMTRKPPSGNILRRLAVCVLRFVLHRFPDYYFMHLLYKKAQRWKGTNSAWLGDFVGESYVPPLEKRIVRERKEVPFEDRMYKIPVDYDTWLGAWFGDYMTLPPEDARKRHTFEAYIKEEAPVREQTVAACPPAEKGNAMPKYSVIIPVYNVQEYLPKCIESVLTQTSASPFEVLLIDDGSTDDSGSLCDQYARDDTRVRVIHQENQGVSTARNTGLKAAQGEYIIFLDSDDWWEPEMLSVLDELFGESTDMVVFGYQRVMESGEKESYSFEFLPEGESGKDYLQKVFDRGLMPLPYACVYAFRRAFLADNELFYDPERCYSEDFEFNTRALVLAKSIVGTDRVLYNWWLRETSATAALTERLVLANLSCKRDVFYRFYAAPIAENFLWFSLMLKDRYHGDMRRICAYINANRDVLRYVSRPTLKVAARLIRVFGYTLGAKLFWLLSGAKGHMKKLLKRGNG